MHVLRQKKTVRTNWCNVLVFSTGISIRIMVVILIFILGIETQVVSLCF